MLQSDVIPYLQKQRRGFSVSTDPEIHQLILNYQNRILNHLLHPKVLQRITNSSLYGNDYDLSNYMIDLRNSIFKADMHQNISSIRQNLQISYVNRLISMLNSNQNFDNISKSSSFYNLSWLKSNLKENTGNLSSRQHKSYLLFLINRALEPN